MRNVHGRRHTLALRGALLVCALLALCSDAFALNPALDISQYAHAVWRVRDGFVKGPITAIAQTPDGYLWLGTATGLFRFDGIRAVPWQPPEGQHLPSNYIVSLLAGDDGTLWVGTNRGLASWNDRTVIRYEELNGRVIVNLLEDHEGSVWASTAVAGKMSLCSVQHRRVQCYGEDGGPGAGAVGLYQDRRGHLWVTTEDGVWHWKPGPRTFTLLPRKLNAIQGLSETDDGALLISMPGGIKRIVNGNAEATYPFPASIQPARAFSLLRDRDGGLWVGTAASGLVHVHQGNTDVFAQSDGLSDDTIYKLFEDREGNIWVVTPEGLDRFRDTAVASFSRKQGLSNSRVQSILPSRDGSIWLSTTGGVNRLGGNTITVYRERRAQIALDALTRGSREVREIIGHGWPAEGALSMFQDRLGRIWVLMKGGVGYIENDRIVPVRGLPGGIMGAIVEDSQNLWVSLICCQVCFACPTTGGTSNTFAGPRWIIRAPLRQWPRIRTKQAYGWDSAMVESSTSLMVGPAHLTAFPTDSGRAPFTTFALIRTVRYGLRPTEG
jgi:Two component regulator propeller